MDNGADARADAELRTALLAWRPDGCELRGALERAELSPLPERFGDMSEYVAAFTAPFLVELFEEVKGRVEAAASSNAVGLACELGAVNSGGRTDLVLRLRADRHSVGHVAPGRSTRPGADAKSTGKWHQHDLVLLSPYAREPRGVARLPIAPPPPSLSTAWSTAEGGEEGELEPIDPRLKRPRTEPPAQSDGLALAASLVRCPRASEPGGGEAGKEEEGAVIDPRRQAVSYSAALAQSAARAGEGASAVILGVVVESGKRQEDFSQIAVRDSPAAQKLLAAKDGSLFRVRVLSLGTLVTSLREWRALQRVGAFPLLQALLPRPPRVPSPPPLTDPRLLASRNDFPPVDLNSRGGAGAPAASANDARTGAHLRTLVQLRQLNESQALALEAVASLRSGAKLVIGPPGTGKTTVVLALLNCLHVAGYNRYYARMLAEACKPNFLDGANSAIDAAAAEAAAVRLENDAPRLLVCAPSNTAVDELLQRVLRHRFVDVSGQIYCPDVLRVGEGATSAEARTVSVDERADKALEQMDADVPAAQRELDLAQGCASDSLRELRECAAHTRARLSRCGGANSEGWAHEREAHAGALTTCWETHRRNALAVRRLRVGTSERPREFRRRELRSIEIAGAQLVFATLSSAGSELVARAGKPFQTVVIDEACQATETAALVPLQYGARRLLLVGDPAQLPATVRSPKAEACGYGRSLFERLQAVGNSASMLTTQYRMHPAIAHFASQRFYSGRLLSPASVSPEQRPPPPALAALARVRQAQGASFAPYAFFHVEGRERRAGAGGQSWANAGEAAFCASLVSQLLGAERAARALPDPPPVAKEEEEEDWGGDGPRPSLPSLAVKSGLREGPAANGPTTSHSSGNGRTEVSAVNGAAHGKKTLGAGGAAFLGAAAPPGCTVPPAAGPLGRTADHSGAAVTPMGGAAALCTTIAILTPYAAQRGVLKGCLCAQLGRELAEKVEVNTVDGFQGREKDIVLFSAVRAPQSDAVRGGGIGFVGKERRMNVAITRARHAMWIVGHAHTLERSSADWSALVTDARCRGVFFDAEQQGQSQGHNQSQHQSHQRPPRGFRQAQAPRADGQARAGNQW